MTPRRTRVFLALFAAITLCSAGVVHADPVGDFFKKLGDSIAKAGRRNAAQRQASTKSSSKKPRTKEAKGTDTQQPVGSPSATPELAADVPVNAAPTVRPASAAPPEPNGRRRDVPYAVPVPERPGFVTSPYAPNHGLVDVRGFDSGTEVKDPYTGKIFLIP